jgi:ParB-like chromosome segregation protein Spo0J
MTMKALKVERVGVNELLPDPINARKHPKRNLDAIRASLRQFGQQKPIIVDMDGVIVAGNGLWEAARLEGLEFVDVVRTDLDDTKKRAFAITDNRTGELSEWDYMALGDSLRLLQDSGWAIEDIEHVGWTNPELEAVFGAVWRKPDAEGNIAEDFARTHASPISISPEQREVFLHVVQLFREKDDKITEGAIVALISKYWLDHEAPTLEI